MTYTEILELIRAGYKRDEIEAMMAAEPAEAAAPAKPPETPPEPNPIVKEETPSPSAETVPEQKHEPTETEKLVAALGLKVDALTRAMQTVNVNSLESSGSTAPTADDILAKIINPHYGEVQNNAR
jgi:hypothetical protein